MGLFFRRTDRVVRCYTGKKGSALATFPNVLYRCQHYGCRAGKTTFPLGPPYTFLDEMSDFNKKNFHFKIDLFVALDAFLGILYFFGIK